MSITQYLICWFLSAQERIFKAILPKEKDNPVKKIAFIKLSELGAIILSYPLLKQIKENYPTSELFFVTFSRNKGISKIIGEIVPEKNILLLREDSPFLFILDTCKLLRRLRYENIDMVFDLEFFSRFSVIFTYIVFAKKRVGFHKYTFEGLYRGNLLTHKVQYNPLIHISKSYLSLGQAIVRREKNSPELEDRIEESKIAFPGYVSDAKIKEKLLVKLRKSGVDFDATERIFLLHPGEGILPLREWPVENFIQLSRLILEEKSNRIFIIGTDGAQGKAELIVSKIASPRCISLVNQTELDMLLELFTMSDVLISNDCGLSHLAMLSQIKKFILFGPESPQIFGPLGDNNWVIYSNWPCSPCLSVFNHRKSSCKNNGAWRC